VPEQLLQRRVLLARRLALDELLAQLVDLAAQLLVLRLRVREARDPAGEVAERLRDAVRGDLERPQHGGGGALRVVPPTVARLAEVDRQQDERDQHEADHDEASPGGLSLAGTAGGGRGAAER